MIVKAKGSDGWFFEIVGPNPSVPRVGDHVTFSDGEGVVRKVTWTPSTFEQKLNADLTVTVECVPA